MLPGPKFSQDWWCLGELGWCHYMLWRLDSGLKCGSYYKLKFIAFVQVEFLSLLHMHMWSWVYLRNFWQAVLEPSLSTCLMVIRFTNDGMSCAYTYWTFLIMLYWSFMTNMFMAFKFPSLWLKFKTQLEVQNAWFSWSLVFSHF